MFTASLSRPNNRKVVPHYNTILNRIVIHAIGCDLYRQVSNFFESANNFGPSVTYP
jgi:hypothetical protein